MLDYLARIETLEKRIERALPPDPSESPKSSPFAELSLGDFIPTISRRFETPSHLAQLLALFERLKREPLRVCVATPPRHGKTETLIHGIAWLLARNPWLQIAYVSYAQRFAEKRNRKIRELARRAGVPIAADAASRQFWQTGVEDGGVWATSVGGQLTGEGFHLMVIDDPIKGRANAESATYRDHAWEWFNDDAFTRLEPTGSVIVNMARWHPDDLTGRLVGAGYEYVNLAALDEQNRPLWPERYTLERLAEIRDTNEYGWASLYQGQPRSRGGRVFGDVHFYDAPPSEGYRLAVGVDMAYTAKTHADWSVAVVARKGDVTYVLDVVRMQARPEDFAQHLQQLRTKYNGAPFHSYVSTTEKGTTALLKSLGGVPIVGHLAKADKFVRAQPVAAAWNGEKVLLPRKAAWLDAFVAEVCGFTGVADRHDDQVDALASAFDSVNAEPAQRRVMAF